MRVLAFFLFLIGFTAFGQVHTVTNLNNAGSGSLRDRIAGANAGDTVQFDPTLLSNGSDTLRLSTEIEIDMAITILGSIQGSDTLYITNTGTNRAFRIDVNTWSTNVYIKDLAFVDFSTTVAGAVIFSDGVSLLELENCIFRDNHVSGNFPSGNAIYATNGDLNLIHRAEAG